MGIPLIRESLVSSFLQDTIKMKVMNAREERTMSTASAATAMSLRQI